MARQCCCVCLDLRQGSYLSAAYTIALGVIGALSFGLAAFNMEQGTYVAIQSWVALVFYVLWVVFAIVLIVGVYKSSRGYLLPWVIFTIIVVILNLISLIGMLINASATFGSGAAIVSFVIFICVILLNIYALWCVISLYKANMVVD